MIRGTQHRPLAIAGLALTMTAALAVGALAQNPSATPTPTPVPSFETTPGGVTLVAYTTPREAYAKIIPLFQATAAGAGVTFEESYARLR